MNWLIFIAASLATFRLTRLATDDKITDWTRALVIREVPKKIKTKVREGISCPFCVSFYFATGVTIGLSLAGMFPAWWWGIFWQPAIWGGSVMWNQVFMKLSK